MKRVVLFAYYNERGIVDEATIYLLKSLKTICEAVIVVVNGRIIDKDKKRLNEIASKIYERNNRGYDWGAYKDYILKYGKELVDKYDELILSNNSYWGPFFPWDESFALMEKVDVDFWGITRYPESREDKIDEHIQGYFIVIRKNMLQSRDFIEFWRKIKYANSYSEAVRYNEIYFTTYNKKIGYSYGALIDFRSGDKKRGYDSTYAEHPFKNIIDLKIPILKKTEVNPFKNIEEIQEFFEWVEGNSMYPLEILLNSLKNMDESNLISPYGFLELENFCRTHEKIYLAGAGFLGHRIEKYLNAKSIEIKGFLVTEKKKDDEQNIIEWNNIALEGNEGVIICSRKYSEAILKIAKIKISEENILVPRNTRKI